MSFFMLFKCSLLFVLHSKMSWITFSQFSLPMLVWLDSSIYVQQRILTYWLKSLLIIMRWLCPVFIYFSLVWLLGLKAYLMKLMRTIYTIFKTTLQLFTSPYAIGLIKFVTIDIKKLMQWLILVLFLFLSVHFIRKIWQHALWLKHVYSSYQIDFTVDKHKALIHVHTCESVIKCVIYSLSNRSSLKNDWSSFRVRFLNLMEYCDVIVTLFTRTSMVESDF